MGSIPQILPLIQVSMLLCIVGTIIEGNGRLTANHFDRLLGSAQFPQMVLRKKLTSGIRPVFTNPFWL
jgi:hypothetical protein